MDGWGKHDLPPTSKPLIIFGFCSESNPFVDAFPRKFFSTIKGK